MAQYKTFSTMSGTGDAKQEPIVEVLRISSPEERYSLVKNNKVVVIDNYTDWCGPCKQCAPRFAKLAQLYGRPGLCAFAKENAEDNISSKPVQISGVPCFHFYINGQYQNDMTITGANISDIEATLKRLLA